MKAKTKTKVKTFPKKELNSLTKAMDNILVKDKVGAVFIIEDTGEGFLTRGGRREMSIEECCYCIANIFDMSVEELGMCMMISNLEVADTKKKKKVAKKKVIKKK